MKSVVDVNEKVAENVKVRLTGAVEDSDGYRDQAFKTPSGCSFFTMGYFRQDEAFNSG